MPLRLPVWNLSVCDGQIMRAADCNPFVGKIRRVFRQSQKRMSRWLIRFLFQIPLDALGDAVHILQGVHAHDLLLIIVGVGHAL